MLRRGLVEAAFEARSEQRIDQQRCRLVSLGQRLDRAGPLRPRRLRGFARRLGERGDAHLDAALREVPRGDIAVAAVIARPAQDQRGKRPGEPVGGLGQCRPGPFHQLRDAGPGVDRRLLGGAHRCGGEDRAAVMAARL